MKQKQTEIIKAKDLLFNKLLFKIGNLHNIDNGTLTLSRANIKINDACQWELTNSFRENDLTITRLNSLYILAFYNNVININELRTLLLDETCNFKSKIYADKLTNLDPKNKLDYAVVISGVIVNIFKN